MKDEYGFTLEDSGFYVINDKTWINVGVAHDRSYIYQKIADGNLVSVVISTKDYVPALHYREWRAKSSGMTWAQIDAGNKQMMGTMK